MCVWVIQQILHILSSFQSKLVRPLPDLRLNSLKGGGNRETSEIEFIIRLELRVLKQMQKYLVNEFVN